MNFTLCVGSAFCAAAFDGWPTPSVGPTLSGALIGGAAIGLSAAIAPTPGFLRVSVAGALTTALVVPANTRTVLPVGAIEPPTDCANVCAGALDEQTLLNARDVEVVAVLPLGGRVYSGAVLDRPAALEGARAP